ncbi:hypothetical protein D3C72_1342760 [compost metagenome]
MIRLDITRVKLEINPEVCKLSEVTLHDPKFSISIGKNVSNAIVTNDDYGYRPFFRHFLIGDGVRY